MKKIKNLFKALARYKKALFVTGLLMIAFAAWYAWPVIVHFQDVDRDRKAIKNPPQVTETTSAKEIVAEYKQHIHPVLVQKCYQCHMNTTQRPLIYHIPVFNTLWAKQHVDQEIRIGRVHWDLSYNFPEESIGSSYEYITRLRDSLEAGDMPPLGYGLFHRGEYLNTEERNRILTWARKGIKEFFQQNANRVTTVVDIPNEQLPDKIAQSIIKACPIADPKDQNAFIQCAQNLGNLEILRDTMNEPFLWGGADAKSPLEFDRADTNRFNPLAWRKIYFSLFMFEPNYRLSKYKDMTTIHLPVRFRSDLGDGEYPYPFWHKEKKWTGYHQSKEVVMFFKDKRLIGAMRSAEKDSTRKVAKKTWDFKWRWGQEGNGDDVEPKVTLYKNLFSKENPYVKDLDGAYRKLALGFNNSNCLSCHSPDNTAKMNMLEFFNYPNQALVSRNRILDVLQRNTMPPGDGIKDQEIRKTMIELATEFRDLAEKALKYDKEHTNDILLGPYVGDKPRTSGPVSH